MAGAAAVLVSGIFAIARYAVKGNAAFATAEPKRIRGKRALHGEAEWMKLTEAAKLFADAGGIVIGERYRVDKDRCCRTLVSGRYA
jgi:type IV secretion system protein VirD4